jgi:hypothetical protein
MAITKGNTTFLTHQMRKIMQNKIIQLKSIDAANVLKIDTTNVSERLADKLEGTGWAGTIFLNGKRYAVEAPLFFTDENGLLEECYEAQVIEDALKQICKLEKKSHCRIEARCRNQSQDRWTSEWEMSLWWNHGRQYENFNFAFTQ